MGDVVLQSNQTTRAPSKDFINALYRAMIPNVKLSGKLTARAKTELRRPS